MNKGYLIRYAVITIIVLLINAYSIYQAGQCSLPQNGNHSLCGMGSILVFLMSVFILVPYSLRTLTYFILQRLNNQNSKRWANIITVIATILIVLCFMLRIYF